MEQNNEPAFYFPLSNGRYVTVAGLYRLETDFGNGPADQNVFQFDKTFSLYYQNKLACRAEQLSKYVQEYNFSPETRKGLCSYIIEQLCKEHPEMFISTKNGTSVQLACLLTGETLVFDSNYQYTGAQYLSGLDARSCQIQEDIAVVQLNQNEDYLCALHLCSPNHWGAADKIGKAFFAVHEPVPHMKRLNQQSHIFTIRTYLYDISLFRGNQKRLDQISAAIHSMSIESLNYKGMLKNKSTILKWLQALKIP